MLGCRFKRTTCSVACPPKKTKSSLGRATVVWRQHPWPFLPPHVRIDLHKGTTYTSIMSLLSMCNCSTNQTMLCLPRNRTRSFLRKNNKQRVPTTRRRNASLPVTVQLHTDRSGNCYLRNLFFVGLSCSKTAPSRFCGQSIFLNTIDHKESCTDVKISWEGRKKG